MIPTPNQLATQAKTKLQTLVTLTQAGIVHPERPDHLWHTVTALLQAGLLEEKPSVGQRHVYLNPRQAGAIRRLIDEGELPTALKLPTKW